MDDYKDYKLKAETTLNKIKAIWGDKLQVTPNIPEEGKDWLIRLRVGSCPKRLRLIALLIGIGITRIGIDFYNGTVSIDLRENKMDALWGYDEEGKVMG